MPCSKGSGPGCNEPQVRLTVYIRTVPGRSRSISGVYSRSGAAYRLRYSRRLSNFMGHSTEAA